MGIDLPTLWFRCGTNWRANMKHEFKLLIDGQSRDGVTTFDVVNPATGETFAQCPKADAAQLEEAVAAARRAFPAWAATPVEARRAGRGAGRCARARQPSSPAC
jgi:delta 1-pyrroline-5-carboxylate dehydrogenase